MKDAVWMSKMMRRTIRREIAFTPGNEWLSVDALALVARLRGPGLRAVLLLAGVACFQSADASVRRCFGLSPSWLAETSAKGSFLPLSLLCVRVCVGMCARRYATDRSMLARVVN